MRTYELVLVVRPSVKDAERKKLIETIHGWLDGIKVKKEDDWGQKPLAYTIKKEVAGYYYLLHLETDKTIPADLERKIIAKDDIIRHLLIRTD